ncbi:conserved hypothetical protein [Frankia canadensis]|uniref:Uncharacterized protein n=1 Tax=Frankia canadensis TaxID=1836972 RepID=A0A2I2KI77_9ACTN|nr:hypothetical protein [Frankia canadensis]SNQ45366.1 conserved hypothetical protein [Frankia canadensis]SOU52656.1 conserved hypothetical protein [Frankia canadensis]
MACWGWGACASLAANVLHAEPTFAARIIAGWPPLALLGSYELLMRQIHPAGHRGADDPAATALSIPPQRDPTLAPTGATSTAAPPTPTPGSAAYPSRADSPETSVNPGGGTGPMDGTLSAELDGGADLSAKREAIIRALDQTEGSATAAVAVLATQGITVSKSWVYQVRKETPYGAHRTAYRPTVRRLRCGMAPAGQTPSDSRPSHPKATRHAPHPTRGPR